MSSKLTLMIVGFVIGVGIVYGMQALNAHYLWTLFYR